MRKLAKTGKKRPAATCHFEPLSAVSPGIGEKKRDRGEAGFTLVEVSSAMVVFLIATLGVFVSFTFAVSHNAGNGARAQALAVLQQKIEQMRSLKFTPAGTDSMLSGGKKNVEIVTAPDGNKFRIQVEVDDDPFMVGTQIDPNKYLKEISVTVTLERPTPGWQTSVPATIILRRVRGN